MDLRWLCIEAVGGKQGESSGEEGPMSRCLLRVWLLADEAVLAEVIGLLSVSVSEGVCVYLPATVLLMMPRSKKGVA